MGRRVSPYMLRQQHGNEGDVVGVRGATHTHMKLYTLGGMGGGREIDGLVDPFFLPICLSNHGSVMAKKGTMIRAVDYLKTNTGRVTKARPPPKNDSNVQQNKTL